MSKQAALSKAEALEIIAAIQAGTATRAQWRKAPAAQELLWEITSYYGRKDLHVKATCECGRKK